MQEKHSVDSEQSRRTFLKTTSAVGAAAATGIAAFGGSASAQTDVIRRIVVVDGGSLLQVNVILTEVLENVNVEIDINTGDIEVVDIDVEENVIILNINVLSEQAIDQLTAIVEGTTASGQEVADSATTQV